MLVFMGQSHVLNIKKSSLGDDLDSVLEYFEAILWFTRLGSEMKYSGE